MLGNHTILYKSLMFSNMIIPPFTNYKNSMTLFNDFKTSKCEITKNDVFYCIIYN